MYSLQGHSASYGLNIYVPFKLMCSDFIVNVLIKEWQPWGVMSTWSRGVPLEVGLRKRVSLF